MDGIFLQMQAFRIARNYWFHIEVFDIIYRNGAKLICGTVIYLFSNQYSTLIDMHIGQAIHKNSLICVMHKPAMLLSVFLVFSNADFVFFKQDLDIVTQFRPKFLLLSVPFIISFAFMIKRRRRRRRRRRRI
jgi:hypothetical protein